MYRRLAKLSTPIKDLIIVTSTVVAVAIAFYLSGGSGIGILICFLLIVAGIFIATRGRGTDKTDALTKQKERMTKPPPAGEYWKNTKVTSEMIDQIFADLEFPYAWMLPGYGSQLARKRLVIGDEKGYEDYDEGYKKMLREIANDLDDSAFDAFIEYAKEKLSSDYFPYDFPHLFKYVAQRDLEKSIPALEQLIESPLKFDNYELCKIIGEIEFAEWNQLALAICHEQKFDSFIFALGKGQQAFSNHDIAEDCFNRDIKYFDLLEKNIPENNLLLKRYHALMKKVNCR